MKNEFKFLRSMALCVVLALGALFASAQAFAGTVTMTWTAPTKCTDESAITNCAITGYEIYMGTSLTGTTYSKRTEAPAATATTIQLLNVASGSRCFFMKTVAGASVSPESNRICITVPAATPAAPVISVTVAIP